MLDTYSNREKEALDVLRIYPLKTVALEQKLDAEVFEEYDPESMVVKVNVWRRMLTSLIEEVLLPTHLKVKKDMKMSDFLA